MCERSRNEQHTRFAELGRHQSARAHQSEPILDELPPNEHLSPPKWDWRVEARRPVKVKKDKLLQVCTAWAEGDKQVHHSQAELVLGIEDLATELHFTHFSFFSFAR
jgi:hypothetical protein